MFQNKTDNITLLVIYRHLIFAEKITDHHHAYNGRSEITHMNLVTCNFTLLNKIWRSVSNKFSIITIFTCQILGIWCSIVTAIKKSNYLYCNALSNKFQAEWNVAKINSNVKCKSEIFFLPQLLISRIYAVDSKLFNLGEVSLREILFHMICVFGYSNRKRLAIDTT